jgi:hypothetical protein
LTAARWIRRYYVGITNNVLGESSLLSADCTGKVAPVSGLRKKTSQEREKFAAVSKLAEVFPLASLKHRKEDACLQIAVGREMIMPSLPGC